MCRCVRCRARQIDSASLVVNPVVGRSLDRVTDSGNDRSVANENLRSLPVRSGGRLGVSSVVWAHDWSRICNLQFTQFLVRTLGNA